MRAALPPGSWSVHNPSASTGTRTRILSVPANAAAASASHGFSTTMRGWSHGREHARPAPACPFLRRGPDSVWASPASLWGSIECPVARRPSQRCEASRATTWSACCRPLTTTTWSGDTGRPREVDSQRAIASRSAVLPPGCSAPNRAPTRSSPCRIRERQRWAGNSAGSATPTRASGTASPASVRLGHRDCGSSAISEFAEGEFAEGEFAGGEFAGRWTRESAVASTDGPAADRAWKRATNVPAAGRVSRYPSAIRRSYTSSAVIREIANCSAIMRLDGMRDPGCTRPDTIRSCNCSKICCCSG